MISLPSLRRALATALFCSGLAAFFTSGAHAAVQLPTGFQDQVLASGLDWPTGIAFLPDGRLLVCELQSGRLRMIVNGELAAIDPIGIVDSIATAGGEQGLLGVVADPRWPSKPFIYTLSAALDSTLRISRFTAAGDLSDGTSGNLAIVAGSRRELIRDIASVTDVHSGGTLRFGPDSLLYVSLGEDAIACTATDTTKLNGVILRLDVRGLPDTPGPPNKPLLAAAGNPWGTSANVNRRLVWERGLRNPFRFSIDKPTGRLFIADVGFAKYEELDVTSTGGLNFGWPYLEGTAPFVTNECGIPAPSGLVGPSFQYDRAEYCANNCSATIIGGVVLRSVPNSTVTFPASYDGRYLFSDYYTGFIWMLRDSSGTWVKAPVVPGQPSTADWARGYTQASDYVLGPDGAVYYALNGYDFASGSGEVRRIAHDNGNVGVESRAAARVEFAPVYPSPSRGSASLRYVLPRAARARLAIYDALGRRVRELQPETSLAAGEHLALWDGRDESGRNVPPGVYMARLGVDGASFARRIPLVR